MRRLSVLFIPLAVVLSLVLFPLVLSEAASATTTPRPQFCAAIKEVGSLTSSSAIKVISGHASSYAHARIELIHAAAYAPTTEVRTAIHAIENDLASSRYNQLKAASDHNPFSAAFYLGKVTYYDVKAAASGVVVYAAYRTCA